MQQGQLADFLVRGQQVAFHPVGKEGQGALAFLARRHALALRGQALGDPGRQLGALDAVDLHRHPGAVKGGKPGAAARGLVQPRQQHQGEDAVVAGRGLGQLLQRGAAVLARLAGGDADFDDLLVGEQAQAAAGGQHRAPVEMRAGDDVHAALGVALRARRRANGVRRLLHQQRLVAMQHIQRPQAFVQVVGELGGGQLHVRRSRRFVSPARPGMARIRWPRSRPCQCTRGRGFPGQWVRPPSRSRGGKTPQAAQGGHGFTVPSRRITCCTMSLCMFW
ncbi:hypothetical protein MASR1M50_14370 [Burkholderiales bacterium]